MDNIIDLIKYSVKTDTRIIIRPYSVHVTISLTRKVGSLTFQEDIDIYKYETAANLIDKGISNLELNIYLHKNEP